MHAGEFALLDRLQMAHRHAGAAGDIGQRQPQRLARLAQFIAGALGKERFLLCRLILVHLALRQWEVRPYTWPTAC